MCVNESHSYKPYEENREQEIAVCNYLNSRMTHKGSLLGVCVIPSINRYFMSFVSLNMGRYGIYKMDVIVLY